MMGYIAKTMGETNIYEHIYEMPELNKTLLQYNCDIIAIKHKCNICKYVIQIA